jgi:hypothetical protein
MIIPTAVIVPLFLVSFVLLAFQYFRINPDRRLLNLHFGLMMGAIVLALVQVGYPGRPMSMVLLLLGLCLLGFSLYLLRRLPPPRH